MKYLIGIDEAGRGPLAGPVAVGVAVVTRDFDWRLLPGVNDSKLLGEQKREAIYSLALDLRKENVISWSVSLVGPSIIDNKGIVFAVNSAMSRALKKVETTIPIDWNDGGVFDYARVQVKLDGGLRAPKHYTRQETIVKGDSKEPVIGLASILAKVTRDRHMVRLSQKDKLGSYDLATHKGYGTKKHRDLIQKHGLSAIHRRSFCRNILIN